MPFCIFSVIPRKHDLYLRFNPPCHLFKLSVILFLIMDVSIEKKWERGKNYDKIMCNSGSRAAVAGAAVGVYNLLHFTLLL